MTNLLMRAFCVAAVLTVHSAWAQDEGESRVKLGDVKEKNVKSDDDDDADEILTNNALRAESGSKSKWSIASTLNYNGGSVQKPLAAERPDITDTTGTTNEALLDGQVSVKYNYSKQNSLMAGVGVRWIAPLESEKPKDYHYSRMDAENPYLTYQHIGKWRGVESVFTASPTAYTEANLRGQGYVSSFLIELENMKELGDSGFSIGVELSAETQYFDKSGAYGNPGDDDFTPDVRTMQSDYLVGFDPVLEYAFNDKINFRAVTTLWNFEHLRSEPRFGSFKADKISQSIGFGISITRDIYLYPNIQFLPENIRADLTNVALNTNINVF